MPPAPRLRLALSLTGITGGSPGQWRSRFMTGCHGQEPKSHHLSTRERPVLRSPGAAVTNDPEWWLMTGSPESRHLRSRCSLKAPGAPFLPLPVPGAPGAPPASGSAATHPTPLRVCARLRSLARTAMAELGPTLGSQDGLVLRPRRNCKDLFSE